MQKGKQRTAREDSKIRRGVRKMSECKHNYVLSLDMKKRTCIICKRDEPKTLSEKIIQKYAKYDIHVKANWKIEEANACVFNLASALDKLEKENEELKIKCKDEYDRGYLDAQRDNYGKEQSE